jgi:integral membrane sensor domain MASE1
LTAQALSVKVCAMNFISLLGRSDWMDVVLLAAGIGLTAGGIIGLVGALWALAEHWWRESHE